MADIEILAEGAKQIAGTEKDRSGTARSHQRRFFPEMGMQARHDGFSSRPTETGFSGEPVNPAIPWTEGAFLHQSDGPIHALPKLSFTIQFQIGRFGHNQLSCQTVLDSYIIKFRHRKMIVRFPAVYP
jgi:hypothetical protein